MKSAIYAFFLLCLLAASASAQQAAQEYTLKLSQAEANAIVSALTKCPIPWEQSNPLLQTLVKQIQDQGPKQEEKK